jgi:hypothetical protein
MMLLLLLHDVAAAASATADAACCCLLPLLPLTETAATLRQRPNGNNLFLSNFQNTFFLS